MDLTAPVVQRLIDELAKLPSIGKKSAQRLAYHLLKQTPEEADRLADAIREAKSKIHECRLCFNYTDAELCPVCSKDGRDKKLICVVEKAADIPVIERGGVFKGVYHILGGALSPIDGITPEHLHIQELLARIDGPGYEIILSTSTGTEGEHTSLYLTRLLKEKNARVTRIARGLPAGSDIQYIDEITLLRAIEGRVTL
ncbi:MAG: recombination mediator RecR [Fibrobacterota bacterium]